ncbi:MAG: hypothetical protein V9G14_17775 [Cypionkella sp.]
MADAELDRERRAGARGLGEIAHRAVAVLGVVLGDGEQRDADRHADHAAREEVQPAPAEQPFRGPGEAHRVEHGGHVEAAGEGAPRIFAVVGAHHHHAEHGGEDAEGARHQREEHQREHARQAVIVAEDDGAEHHRAQALGDGGLEHARGPAGRVAHHVTGEIGDRRGVLAVILAEPELAAAEIRAEIRGLGEGAAADLGEQRGERGAERVAGDHERDLGGEAQRGRRVLAEATLDGEHHREEAGPARAGSPR